MSYKINHIPSSTPHNRRPGHKLAATTITIHNTGNPSSTASNERAWLTNPSNAVTASYHLVLDEKETIECIPLHEVAWAAGDGGTGPGNRTSIHIEICESGNYAQTLERAIELVAAMLRERDWGIADLRRHYDWPRPSNGYRKICPRLMYDNGSWSGWEQFKYRVSQRLSGNSGDSDKDDQQHENKGKNDADIMGHWAESDIKAAIAAGWLQGYPDGTFRPNEGVTRAELAVLLSRLQQVFRKM